MYNNLIPFLQQQAALSGQRSEKPSFYRDFLLDSQINGPTTLGSVPSITRVGPDITFVRNSSATIINQSGNIQRVGTNIPRFEWIDHRTNLLSASNNINSNAWVGYFAKSPQWSQNVTGPDGVQNSAWSLPLSAAVFGPGNFRTGIMQFISPLVSGTPITVSVWARADDNSASQILFGTTDGFSPDINSQLTTSWKRFEYKTFYNPGAGNGARGTQFVVISGTSTNNNSRVYVYGFQCEVGTTATSYISSDTASRTVSQPAGLLIEEGRTNVITFSENFTDSSWVKTNTTLSGVNVLAPDNTVTGTIAYQTTTSGNIEDQALTVSTGSVVSYSLYFKYGNHDWVFLTLQQNGDDNNRVQGWFNIRTGSLGSLTSAGAGSAVLHTIKNVGNGWYRCTLIGSIGGVSSYSIKFASADSNSSTTNVINGVHWVWGAQLEEGEFPTSYIPTNGASQQRLPDDVAVTGNGAAAIYNKGEGSLFVEGVVRNSSGTPWFYTLHDDTASNYIGIYTDVSNNLIGHAYRKNGQSDTLATNQYNLQNDNIVRVCTNYNSDDANLFVNGQKIGNMPTLKLPIKVNALSVGKIVNTGYIGGYVRKLGFWPKKLSDQTLQAISNQQIGFAKYFANDGSLYTGAGPGAEFSRNSLATYYDSNGLLKFTGGDKPRFDYDPILKINKGLLIEEQRTNLLLYSSQFENNYWDKLSVTVTPNQTIAPDGTNTADGLYETLDDTFHIIRELNVATVDSIVTATIFVKANGRTKFSCQIGGSDSVLFDLANKTATVLFPNVDPSSRAQGSIVELSNGWFRCIATRRSTINGNVSWVLRDDDSNITYRGDTTKGIYIWGAQLETGAFATSYIETNNSQVTRASDTVQISPQPFSTFFNQEQGTFYAKVLPLSGIQAAAVLDVGNIYNSIHGIWKSGPGGDGSEGTSWNTFSNSSFLSAGAQQTSLTSNFISTQLVANSAARIAYSYQFNNFNTSVNSNLVTQTTVTSAIPALLNYNYFNGHIQTIEYYNTQLTNQQLTALSA